MPSKFCVTGLALEMEICALIEEIDAEASATAMDKIDRPKRWVEETGYFIESLTSMDL